MALSVNKFLTSAILRILKPLIQVCLRNGVSYKAFSDLAKWVYIDVAEKDFSLPGKKQTTSRISVLTGLSRKEVARVQQLSGPEDELSEKKYNRAARVISGWLQDPVFQDETGNPATLVINGPVSSFSALVKQYSGDMPAKAVLDELQRVGTVSVSNDEVSLLSQGYIPSQSDDDKFYIMGSDAALLLQTITHNIEQTDEDAFYQRKVMYDNLPEECLAEFKTMSAEKSQALLQELNQYLSQHDRDNNQAVTGTGQKRAGVGIYYFEEDVQPGHPKESKDD